MGLLDPKKGKTDQDKIGRFDWLLLVVYLFYQPAKYFWNRVYGRGLMSIPLVLAAAVTGIYVSVSSGHLLRDQLAADAWLSITAAVVAWPLFVVYGFPAIWLWVVSPIWSLGDTIQFWTREFLKKHAEPFFGALVRGINWLTPLSGLAWKALKETEQKSLALRVLRGIAYLFVVAASAYSGWLSFHFILPLVAHWVPFAGIGYGLGTALGAGASVLVFWVLTSVSVQVIDYGGLCFLGLASSAALVWGAPDWLVAPAVGYVGTILAPALDAGTAATTAYWAVMLVSLVVTAGYVFPLLGLLLSNGFWSALLSKIEPMARKAYGEDNKTYGYFIRHVLTLVTSALITWAAYTAGTTLALPLYATIALLAVTAWCAYALVFKATNHDAGLFLFGLAASLLSAWQVGGAYVAHGWPYGIWGAIVVSIFTVLKMSMIVVPLVLLAVRGVLFFLGNLGLAGPASAVFTKSNETYLHMQERFGHLVESVYDHKEEPSAWRRQFLHVSNLVGTFGTWVATGQLCAAVGISGWGAWVMLTVLPLSVYLFVGRILLQTKRGVPFVAAVSGLLLACAVGILLFATDSGLSAWLAAGLAAGFTLASWTFLLFPLAFEAAQVCTASWTVGWLGPLLGFIYDLVWSPVGWVWDHVRDSWFAVVAWAAPYWEALVARFQKVREAYERLLKRIRGG